MSASLGGALKVKVEALGLGLSAFRDDAGKTPALTTWVTISEGVSITTAALGDSGAADAVTELVQVDLWQRVDLWNPPIAVADGGLREDYDLADQLARGLHGITLPDAPTHVYRCTVDDVQRFVEEDSNLVHHAITLRIRRER